MKEITITYTVRITDIRRVSDETATICGNEKERMRALAKRIKNEFGFDDVIVTDLKGFEREVADD